MNAPSRHCLLLLSLFAGACSTSGPSWAEMDYPGELRPAAALPHELLWQQRISSCGR
jgi:hypothetical protein